MNYFLFKFCFIKTEVKSICPGCFKVLFHQKTWSRRHCSVTSRLTDSAHFEGFCVKIEEAQKEGLIHREDRCVEIILWHTTAIMRVRLRHGLTMLLLVVAGMLLVLNLLTALSDPHTQPGIQLLGLPIAPGGAPDVINNMQFIPRLAPPDQRQHPTPPSRTRLGALHSDASKLWPGAHNITTDRIVSQLTYRPAGERNSLRLKTILTMNRLSDESERGQARFFRDECSVTSCTLTDDQDILPTADALVFESDPRFGSRQVRTPNQIWILYVLESPLHTPWMQSFRSKVNWTATYRADSTLVAPYEKFVPFNNASHIHRPHPPRDYAKGKTKMVAWFVSNCDPSNERMAYVEKLQRYIKVDIYGSCGNMSCSRRDQDHCFKMLQKDYKFYLSFENSNCEHYITEKFYWNALWNDVVPIVMGARKEDYALVAPPGSYIHVEDFRSARQLADYLQKLDRNPALYNKYFEWKGTGEFINTKFWCRVCAMLHAPHHMTWYEDVESWWRGNKTCTRDRWDNPSDIITNWKEYIEEGWD